MVANILRILAWQETKGRIFLPGNDGRSNSECVIAYYEQELLGEYKAQLALHVIFTTA
jgi:hypothetical protein